MVPTYVNLYNLVPFCFLSSYFFVFFIFVLFFLYYFLFSFHLQLLLFNSCIPYVCIPSSVYVYGIYMCVYKVRGGRWTFNKMKSRLWSAVTLISLMPVFISTHDAATPDFFLFLLRLLLLLLVGFSI